MEARKYKGRNIEEVSHLFLSHQNAPDVRKIPTEDVSRPGISGLVPLTGDSAYREKGEVAASTAGAEQKLCLLLSSEHLFVEKSFLACNLALELAKKSISVGLIETTARLPNTFFLMGSLLPESTGTEGASPSADMMPKTRPSHPVFEHLKLVNIPINGRKGIKAAFMLNGPGSVDTLETFLKLRRESRFLIVNTTPDIFKFKETISSMNPFFIVPTTADPEELLQSYALVKRISQVMDCPEVGLLIIEESADNNAEGAYHIIKEMTKKFLSAGIHFMGTIPTGDGLSKSILTRSPLCLKAESSPVSRSIVKLADHVIRRNVPSSEGDL
ncbi:MinD/ParA family protein [Thermodesulfobacteriota bacterium]